MRRTTFLAALGLAALSLSACNKPPENPDAHPQAADTPSDFSLPMEARGDIPNWSLMITDATITLHRDGLPDVVAVPRPGAIRLHAATWAGTLPNGQTLTVNLYASPCSQGANGATYPFSAEVVLPDTSPLDGCGGGALNAPTTGPLTPTS